MKAGMRTVCGALVALAIATPGASALEFDFSGTFQNDNDVQFFSFSISATTTVTAFSSSWLSGDSGLGFDPILALWDSSGNLIEQQDDGSFDGSTLSKRRIVRARI